jgi:YfiH family protein
VFSRTETPQGLKIEGDDFLILFGNREARLENLKALYPQLQFCRMKQVHGHTILEAKVEGEIREGDAQLTQQKNWALNVITADCTPVMFFCPRGKYIAGAHAGWRGVQQRIVPLTLEKLKALGCSIGNLHIFIGPHIEQKSFQVQEDVSQALLASFSNPNKSSVVLKNETGFLIDLEKILIEQLQEYGVKPSQIHSDSHDTMTDLRFHSFRRDKESSGRQISFIALK